MLGNLKFNPAKSETTCRLCLARIKLMKNKRNSQMKMYRREIADLLRTGKQDFARIRVEAVIREACTLQALEVLELYLELLAVRCALVAQSREIPRDMVEAISSILYAASRLPDLPELTTLHKMFAVKYGKEYVQEASTDGTAQKWMVNRSMRQCLTIEPPDPALKLEMLSEIAQEHGVEWDLDRARRELLPPPPPAAAAPYTIVPLTAVQQPQQPPAAPVAPAPPPGGPLQMSPLPGPAPAPAAPAPHLPPVLPAQPQLTPPPPHAGAAPPPPGGRPPPPGWLTGLSPYEAPPAAPKDGGPASTASAPAVLGGSGSGGGGFTERSAEEVQRAYDAALGPPVKAAATPPEWSAVGPAPRATQPPYPQHQAPPPAPPVRDPPVATATAAPGGAGPSAAAAVAAVDEPLPAPPSADSEFDELQRRFEALKGRR